MKREHYRSFRRYVFQSVTCTGTDNQTRTTRAKTRRKNTKFVLKEYYINITAKQVSFKAIFV